MRHTTSELTRIPGIGPVMARHCHDWLGITSISDFKNQNPEQLYQRAEKAVGGHLDRCVLYCFRCAVHFAEHDTENTVRPIYNWWDFKD